MFRSSTIIKELALNLVKVIFMIQNSVKWQHAATQRHNKERPNFTKCFIINVTLTRFSASSLMMFEDRNV